MVSRYGDGGFAVAQGEGQGTVVVDRQASRAGQGDGVDDVAAFGHLLGSRQLGHDFGQGVLDFDTGRRLGQHQVLERATIRHARTGDAHSQGAAVDVDVFTLRVVGPDRRSLAFLDDHRLACTQLHSQVLVQGLLDADGEGRLLVLEHRRLVGNDA
ncbi:hypothetical protein D3C79_802790 [compost metagenome]